MERNAAYTCDKNIQKSTLRKEKVTIGAKKQKRPRKNIED